MKYLDENGYRIYSNDTMRKLKAYMDLKDLKPGEKGYNEVLENIDLILSDKRLRTEEEIVADKLAREEL